MSNELQQFVREALVKGASKHEIRQALVAAHWPDDEITASLDMFSDAPFVVPVPRRKPYLSAREAFMYAVLFVCLYISAFSFGSLLFDFINRWIPDALTQNYYPNDTASGIRNAIAALVVAYPLFLWLSSMMNKTLRRDPEKRGSKIRKWLTYITLFVAASFIIGDLITLITNLLGGELTLRFGLKVFTILLIAGVTFGYYLWDLRSEEQ